LQETSSYGVSARAAVTCYRRSLPKLMENQGNGGGILDESLLRSGWYLQWKAKCN
jgi:hypothetical protein